MAVCFLLPAGRHGLGARFGVGLQPQRQRGMLCRWVGVSLWRGVGGARRCGGRAGSGKGAFRHGRPVDTRADQLERRGAAAGNVSRTLAIGSFFLRVVCRGFE